MFSNPSNRSTRSSQLSQIRYADCFQRVRRYCNEYHHHQNNYYIQNNYYLGDGCRHRNHQSRHRCYGRIHDRSGTQNKQRRKPPLYIPQFDSGRHPLAELGKTWCSAASRLGSNVGSVFRALIS